MFVFLQVTLFSCFFCHGWALPVVDRILKWKSNIDVTLTSKVYPLKSLGVLCKLHNNLLAGLKDVLTCYWHFLSPARRKLLDYHKWSIDSPGIICNLPSVGLPYLTLPAWGSTNLTKHKHNLEILWVELGRLKKGNIEKGHICSFWVQMKTLGESWSLICGEEAAPPYESVRWRKRW